MSSELIREFSVTISEGPQKAYVARVRGNKDELGHWHGWIEFLPQDGGTAFQTGRETTQSSYDDLEYWASGLTTAYLEMALERARRTDSLTPPPPLAHPDPEFDAARIREPQADSAVVRIELETLDPTVPLRLMASTVLFEGRVRRIPGAGILVYDGMSAEEGEPTRHAFLLQYGSENAAAVLANHLWSELHGEGVTLRIEGTVVELDNHEMNKQLKALLHRSKV
jgi:hypothetical protein